MCRNNEIIPFKKTFKDYRTDTLKNEYRSSSKQCRSCPLNESYLSKTAKEKRITVTYYREEYERNIERVKSQQGKWMKYKRSSTVEPVFGTLTQFMGLRKINTIGIKQANKVMHMAAIAYNLKKYLKFIEKKAKSDTKQAAPYLFLKKVLQNLFSSILSSPKNL